MMNLRNTFRTLTSSVPQSGQRLGASAIRLLARKANAAQDSAEESLSYRDGTAAAWGRLHMRRQS
jgi:hypothetical protein